MIKIKDKSKKTSIIISILALLISILGVFFPFFYTNHSLLFSTLVIEYNNDKGIEVPLLFSNCGNKEEVILNSVLYLEIKTDTTSSFKRISSLKSDCFPIILSPNENRIIQLIGNYEDYFKGLIVIKNDSISDYLNVVDYTNLELLINISYISSNGSMNSEQKSIAYLSFDELQNISLIQGEPIKLEKLKIKDKSENMGYYSMPKTYKSGNFSINLKDTIAIRENINRLKFIENHLPDSLKQIIQKYYSH